MSYSVRGTPVSTSTPDQETLLVTLPTDPDSVEEGDTVIISATCDQGGITLAIAGKTPILSSDDSHVLFTWQWTAGASEPATRTITGIQAGQGCSATVGTFNPDGGTVVQDDEAATTLSTTNTITTAEIIVVAGDDGGLVWDAFSHDGIATVSTPPTGMELAGGVTTPAGKSVTLACYYELDVSGGARTDMIIWSGADQKAAHALCWSETGPEEEEADEFVTVLIKPSSAAP